VHRVKERQSTKVLSVASSGCLQISLKITTHLYNRKPIQNTNFILAQAPEPFFLKASASHMLTTPIIEDLTNSALYQLAER
jgi:hypothetical protein